MLKKLSNLLDWFSEFLAYRKGLLPIGGILFVLANFLLKLFAANSFLATTDLFLHLGIVVAILGVLLAWAL
jgi:hypothetical protein